MSLKELRNKRKQEYLDSLPTDKEFKAMSLNEKMKYISNRDFDNITTKAKKRRSFLGKMMMGVSMCAMVGGGVTGISSVLDEIQYANASSVVREANTDIYHAEQLIESAKGPVLRVLQNDNIAYAYQEKSLATSLRDLAQNKMKEIEEGRSGKRSGIRFCLALAGVMGVLGVGAKLLPVAKNRAAYKAFVMKRSRGCRAREHSLL